MNVSLSNIHFLKVGPTCTLAALFHSFGVISGGVFWPIRSSAVETLLFQERFRATICKLTKTTSGSNWLVDLTSFHLAMGNEKRIKQMNMKRNRESMEMLRNIRKKIIRKLIYIVQHLYRWLASVNLIISLRKRFENEILSYLGHDISGRDSCAKVHN